MNHHSVAIVILNYNGLADTLECLASLYRGNLSDELIIVVDNGSEENVETVSTAFPHIILIRNPINMGWAGGNNAGIKYAMKMGCETVVLLNNDTIVATNFLDRLYAAGFASPEYSILGVLIGSANNPTQTITAGVYYNHSNYNGFFQEHSIPALKIDPPTIQPTEIVNGCCMVIKKKVFEEVGLIDEKFFLVHEESDFCLRALERGMKCGIISERLILHKHGNSFQRSGNWLKTYYDVRNTWLLLCKHAGKTPYGRKLFTSIVQYLKYIRYAYSRAVEAKDPKLITAVIEGVSDAWTGQYGPKQISSPLMKAIVKGFLRTLLFISKIIKK